MICSFSPIVKLLMRPLGPVYMSVTHRSHSTSMRLSQAEPCCCKNPPAPAPRPIMEARRNLAGHPANTYGGYVFSSIPPSGGKVSVSLRAPWGMRLQRTEPHAAGIAAAHRSRQGPRPLLRIAEAGLASLPRPEPDATTNQAAADGADGTARGRGRERRWQASGSSASDRPRL